MLASAFTACDSSSNLCAQLQLACYPNAKRKGQKEVADSFFLGGEPRVMELVLVFTITVSSVARLLGLSVLWNRSFLRHLQAMWDSQLIESNGGWRPKSAESETRIGIPLWEPRPPTCPCRNTTSDNSSASGESYWKRGAVCFTLLFHIQYHSNVLRLQEPDYPEWWLERKSMIPVIIPIPLPC